MLKYVFFVVFYFPVVAFSQFYDDFGNGNFTHDPAWVGDHDLFVVEEGLLRLNDDKAGIAYLSTESRIIDEAQWDLWLKISFTPSDNNHPRIYLVSDRPDLRGPLNGYFIQVGRSGTENKRLFLCRQDGESITTLMSGTYNLAEGSSSTIRLRVRRDKAGNWTLFADAGLDGIYIPQGSVFDNTHTNAGWFGLLCRYTISNSRGFYFDDIRVGEIIPDDPPVVVSVRVESAAVLDVMFSGPVCGGSAANTGNYSVDQGVGHPLSAACDDIRPHMVRLLFAGHFRENHLYSIEIKGVRGADGQLMKDYMGQFARYIPQRFDIVFNELMVNSSPVAGLPPYDWFELHNTLDIPVYLDGWQFQHGSVFREIPAAFIPAGGFLVLTSETAYSSLRDYGNVSAIPGLPLNALTIGGNTLALWDNNMQLISFVSYSDTWYGDYSKAEGGWSLEKIDPDNLCQGKANWTASKDISGGTPGRENSVRAKNPDNSLPGLRWLGFKAPDRVTLWFSEPMDEATLLDTENYFIDKGIGKPEQATVHLPHLDKAELILASHPERGKAYHLEAGAGLYDCSGNRLSPVQKVLSVPEQAGPDDIVINEILFNPNQGCARYVELYNRSENTFDLKDYILASADTVAGVLTTVRYLSDSSILFPPGSFVLVSNDTASVRRHFPFSDPTVFIEIERMPAMTNNSGVLVLSSRGHSVIDMLAYDNSMHWPVFSDNKGIALERLNPDRPSLDPSSWHSAASTIGYGSPGLPNSQFISSADKSGQRFSVSPAVFFPDASGKDDVLTIAYRLEKTGYSANIRIFAPDGRLVRNLCRGKLLATSGELSWDGTTDRGEKAAVGSYIIHVEIYNHLGQVEQYKLRAVLAARF